MNINTNKPLIPSIQSMFPTIPPTAGIMPMPANPEPNANPIAQNILLPLLQSGWAYQNPEIFNNFQNALLDTAPINLRLIKQKDTFGVLEPRLQNILDLYSLTNNNSHKIDIYNFLIDELAKSKTQPEAYALLLVLERLYANTEEPKIKSKITNFLIENIFILNDIPYEILPVNSADMLLHKLPMEVLNNIPETRPFLINTFNKNLHFAFNEVKFADAPVKTFKSLMDEFAYLKLDTNLLAGDASQKYREALVDLAMFLVSAQAEGLNTMVLQKHDLFTLNDVNTNLENTQLYKELILTMISNFEDINHPIAAVLAADFKMQIIEQLKRL